MAEVFRATLPFLLLLLLALLAITRFPSISLGLVDRDDDGHSAFTGDCDDTDPRMNLADADGDGVTTCGRDCAAFRATCKPGAPAIPAHWRDNDCLRDSDEAADGAEEKGASGGPLAGPRIGRAP